MTLRGGHASNRRKDLCEWLVLNETDSLREKQLQVRPDLRLTDF